MLLITAFSVTGCLKSGGEVSYTDLDKLAASAGETPARFDVNVKDAVVSCVGNGCFHLEDAKGAVLVEQNSCTLIAGQSVTGPFKGMISKRNGCAVITSPDYGEAVISEGAKLPRTTLSLKELLGDITPYISRRVRIKGVYVDAGIEPGSRMERSGMISQGGEIIKIFNQSGSAEILQDQTGVITAYPFVDEYGPELLVYTSDQFSLDDTEFGRYNFTDEDDPELLKPYVQFNQTSVGNGLFRVMSYKGKWATEFKYDPSAVIGSSVRLTITTIGNGVEDSGTYNCEILVKSGGKLWLRKSGSMEGFIIGCEK